MAHAIAFDTLAYAKKLESYGVVSKQAEAHAEALAEVLDFNFVSKKDSETTQDKLAQIIEKRFDMLDNKFNMIDRKFDMVENKFNMIDSKFEMVDNKFDMVDSKLDLLQSSLRQEMVHIKVEVIKWVVGIAFAQTALILSVLKFFH